MRPVTAAPLSMRLILCLGFLTPGFAQEKGWVQAAIKGSWETAAPHIHFTGWGDCQKDPSPDGDAAKELGAAPERCFVIEDAVSGIQAAKAGGMAALGLARAGDAEMLAAADADIVVESLDDVDLDALREGRLVTKVATWSK